MLTPYAELLGRRASGTAVGAFTCYDVERGDRRARCGEAIRTRVAAPLSLHGASGIPDDLVRRAITAGVAKVNVNTELRQAYLAASERTIGSVLDGSRLNALHAAQVAAVEEVITMKLRAFDTRVPA